MQTDAQSGTSTVQLHYVVMAVKIHNKSTENVKFCTMQSCKPMHKAATQIHKHCKSELRGIHVQVHYTTNPTSMILQKLRCHTYTQDWDILLGGGEGEWTGTHSRDVKVLHGGRLGESGEACMRGR